MADPHTTDSSPVFDPIPRVRKRTTRPRPIQANQDHVPQRATSRRDPRRAALALERARICARIAEDNRAKDILVLDLRETTPLVDFFVIATAAARRQSHAVAGEIDHAMKKLGEAKLGLEGSEEGRWILIDYGDFVVHIFSPEYRAYYALEEIWGDAPQVAWQETEMDRSGVES
jgi:ribosome-associated protein